MKKIIILFAVILTSALTALSITRSNTKLVSITTIKKNDFAAKSLNSATDNLATAD